MPSAARLTLLAQLVVGTQAVRHLRSDGQVPEPLLHPLLQHWPALQAEQAVGEQAVQQDTSPRRGMGYFEGCPVKMDEHRRSSAPPLLPNRFRSLAALRQKALPAQDRLRWKKCAQGVPIGRQTSTEYASECCEAYAFCAGCGKIDTETNRCGECQGGYRLQGPVNLEKCTMCDDYEDWEDNSGMTCADYERQSICSNGRPPNTPSLDEPSSGVKPTDACCACGGGTITLTPWEYPSSGIALYAGETDVALYPEPQTAFRYEVAPGCDLAKLGLTMNNDGVVRGTVTSMEGTGDTTLTCDVTAVQDPLRGLQSNRKLIIAVRDISYGPTAIVFALADGAPLPVGQSEFTLYHGGVNFTYGDHACVPRVPWISIDGDGQLTYEPAETSKSGGVIMEDSASMEGGQCTLEGTLDGREVKLTFIVLRIHLWKAMKYAHGAFARKGKAMLPIELEREAPDGYKTARDPATGQKYYYSTTATGSSSVWVPRAKRPAILDVYCEGDTNEVTKQIHWSRKTGIVTIKGQTAFRIDPEDGTVSGTSKVDLPGRLGQSRMTINCHVAAGGKYYPDAMSAKVVITLVDNVCFFRAIPQGKVWAELYAGKRDCNLACRYRADCAAYYEENSKCYMLSSNMIDGMTTQPAAIYVRTSCAEGTTCLEVQAPGASFLEGKYCPRALNQQGLAVYARSGMTDRDLLFLYKDGKDGSCPLQGVSGTHWTLRRQGSSDYTNPDTGAVELRGEPVACINGDVESEAFNAALYTTTISLSVTTFDAQELATSNAMTQPADISLTAQMCRTPDDTQGLQFGPAETKLGYSLDACECFGRSYKDVAPVTEEARAAVATEEPYNSFAPDPVMLWEGPYVCEDGKKLINGQYYDTDQQACQGFCVSKADCNFFAFFASTNLCILYWGCNRLGHTGLGEMIKVFGVFPDATKYCHIADPDACWESRRRRELLEGKLEGPSLASGAVSAPSDPGAADNCAFQEQLVMCDAIQMATTEKAGTCSRCSYYTLSSLAGQGRSKEPVPSFFPGGSQLSIACLSRESRLLNKKTRQKMDRAVITCVDGQWKDHGAVETVTVEGDGANKVEITSMPSVGDAVFHGDGTDKFTSLGDFDGRVFLYVKAHKTAYKGKTATSAMWTIVSPMPLVVYLNFYGGSSAITGTCAGWLTTTQSKWVKMIDMTGVQFGNSGPGVVYRQEFAAGDIYINGAGDCGTGFPLAFLEPKSNYDDTVDDVSLYSCEECVHVAQYKYKAYLSTSSPELYFLTRRTMQYHVGAENKGCMSATEHALAPLVHEVSGKCLEDAGGTPNGRPQLVDHCTDLWMLTVRGQFVSASTGMCLRWGGTFVTSPCSDVAVGQRFILDHLTGTIRLAHNPAQCMLVKNGGLKLSDDNDPACKAEKWYFDGGMCRFKMITQSMDTPLMFRYQFGDGAYYGVEEQDDLRQPLSQVTQDDMAFGACRLSLSAALNTGDRAMFQTLTLIGQDSKRVSTEYARPLMVVFKTGLDADQRAVVLVSPIGGAAGLKAIQEMKDKIDQLHANIAKIKAECLPVKAQAMVDPRPLAAVDVTNVEFQRYGNDAPDNAAVVTLSSQFVRKNHYKVRYYSSRRRRPAGAYYYRWDRSVGVGTSTAVPTQDASLAADITFGSRTPSSTLSWSEESRELQCQTGQVVSQIILQKPSSLTVKCAAVSGLESDFWDTSFSEWSDPTQAKQKFNWPGKVVPDDDGPIQATDKQKERWLVGVNMATFPGDPNTFRDEDDDFGFRFRSVKLCRDRSPEISMLTTRINDLQKEQDKISTKEVTVVDGLPIAVEDIQNIDIEYPMDGITVNTKMGSRCDLVHPGDPGSSAAYTITPGQFRDLMARAEYHATAAASPLSSIAPFAAKFDEPAKAIQIGWFTPLHNGATVWSIKCGQRAVVTLQEGAAAPHCVFANAETEDYEYSAILPNSAACQPGFAMGGWANAVGESVRGNITLGLGGPATYVEMYMWCRLVPGLSTACEEKEGACSADEVVTGINNAETGVKYKCCKAPKIMGQLFASRHVAELQDFEGYYCPARLDHTGRPEYEMTEHSGPNNNRHGEDRYPTTQGTARASNSGTNLKLWCGPGEALSQWRQIRVTRLSFTCTSVGLDVDSRFGFSASGCSPGTGGGNTATCSAGKAIQGLDMSSQGTIVKVSCCPMTTPSTLSEKTTGESGIRCGEGEVLNKFAQTKYTCLGFYRRTFARGDDASLRWDALKGAWSIMQAEAFQVRTPIKEATGQASDLNGQKMECDNDYALKAWHLEVYMAGKINVAFQCYKALLEGPRTAKETAQITRLSTFPEVDCGNGKVLTGIEFTASKLKYWCQKQTISEAKKSECSEDFTPSVTDSAKIYQLTHMPIRCQKLGQALRAFRMDSSTVRFKVRCCRTVGDVDVQTGDPGFSSEPQAVVSTVDAYQRETRPLLTVTSSETQGATFKVAGVVVYEKSVDAIHAVALDEVNFDVLDTQTWGAAHQASMATYITGLPKHRVVMLVLKPVVFAALLPASIYALQYLGSKVMASAEGNHYVLVGRVGGTQLGENTNPTSAVVSTRLMPIFLAAPIVDFPAAFLTEVAEEDPFPKEKPLKPALTKFDPVRPDYDELCDQKEREHPLPRDDVPATHPCLRVYGANGGNDPLDSEYVWGCHERDIGRSQWFAKTEQQQIHWDANSEFWEHMFDIMEIGLQLLAALVGAPIFGCFAEPFHDAAGGLVKVVDISVKHIRWNVMWNGWEKDNNKMEEALDDKLVKEHFDPRTKKGEEEATEDPLAAASTFSENEDPDTLTATEETPPTEEPKPAEPFGSQYLPEVLPPDVYGDNQAMNQKAFGKANYGDCDPFQTGISKAYCDLYCQNSAIKLGDGAILKNIQRSHDALMSNIDKLLDYHTQTVFWGLGQLQQMLAPSAKKIAPLKLKVGEYRKEVQGYAIATSAWQAEKEKEEAAAKAAKAAAAEANFVQVGPAPDDTAAFIEELHTLPSLLSMNISKFNVPSPDAAEWHRGASEALVSRIGALLERITPANAQDTLSRVHEVVRKFVTERNMRFLQQAPKGAEARAAVVQDDIRASRKMVRRARQQLQAVTHPNPNPRSLSGMLLVNDEVLLRWNQVVDFLVRAHERHAIYVESYAQALDAAEVYLADIDRYYACGMEPGELHDSWLRTQQAQEHADEQLLEAWGATGAAHERLQVATTQGLVERVAETAAIEAPYEVLPCGDLQAVATRVHKAAVDAVDKALWPIAEQVVTLERIRMYQDEQMRKRRLQAPPVLSSRNTAETLFAVCAASESPQTQEGRSLAARALDGLGLRACPAPQGCAGMLLRNTSFGAWASTAPGDLIRGRTPEGAQVVGCIAGGHFEANKKAPVMSTGSFLLLGLYDLLQGLSATVLHLAGIQEVAPEAPTVYSTTYMDCDVQSRSDLAVLLQPQQSKVKLAMRFLLR